ncbi:60S acidic ribosomal protein P0-like [Pyrus ussuriensis x Pyrus communis]|uniref:60S acidic ribosomal protein P0-like n=1 Tax=Pyrus ussuriensis x Pyrus communis TaxID=2448454 RepID=A0A5N5F0T3_9ROSA|nr:60S acidic ribosomal protein P0-like [Pyrus ussuriensis x Pyrus communis]
MGDVLMIFEWMGDHITPHHLGMAGAPARVGLVAPIDVVVPPGNTGLDPSQTSFFQVLNIPTKINKVLDLTEDLMEKFASGVSMVISLALAISYPILATAPHMFLNAYKNVLAVSIAID